MLCIVRHHRIVCNTAIVSFFIAFGILMCAAFPFVAQAQESTIPEGHDCTSSAMLDLLSRDGNFIRVSAPADPALSPSRQGAPQTTAASLSSESLETLRRAYKRFAKLSRTGDLRAQVNLAVASLAGWGTAPNSGAALYWLQEAARQGYPLAFFDLGILYQNGCGVRQDDAEAAHYFQRGADAGDAPSQMNLGYFYDQGLGVARDRAQAASWYRKAAESGLAEAQFNLADLYLRGEGVPLDESLAFSWFQKAAVKGHTAAQIMLGCMYAEGRGTTQDISSAYAWLSVAAMQGDSRADVQLASIEGKLSASQLADAKIRAASILETLARSNKRSSEVAALR